MKRFSLLICLVFLFSGCATTDTSTLKIMSGRISKLEQDNKVSTASTTKISPSDFLQTLNINLDNEKLTDEAFREIVRKTVPIVDIPAIRR